VVSLPESTAEPTEGTITRVTASVDSSSRTMLAEIELENSSLRFQPGSYAQATLSAPQGTSGWTIPTSTLSMRVDGPHVAIVNEQNRIELKAVSLGRNLGDRVVAAGLRGDERLVINPGDQLQSGVEVQIGSRSGGRNKDGISDQPQIGRPGGTTTSRPQLGAKG
jgi:multidrug efflux pump subunit AcrA (membrane-fusion protein)